MFKIAKPLALIVETPLHAGSGSDLGIVDLPIQREKHTNYPKIEASSLKGSLREVFEFHEKNKTQFPGLAGAMQECIDVTFGPTENSAEHAGAMAFTDARLLLFPVKSMKGVFAWITCPAVIDRFFRDLQQAKVSPLVVNPQDPASPTIKPKDLENTVTRTTGLFIKALDENTGIVVLEEYAFDSVRKDEGCTTLAEWLATNLLPEGDAYRFWREKIKQDILVLSDKDFQDFVTMSTEVIARTKIDDQTGTVEQGALWYEEYLPSDTILYSLALASDPFTKEKPAGMCQSADGIMQFFTQGLAASRNIIQIGGNATIGKGLVRTHLLNATGGTNNGSK